MNKTVLAKKYLLFFVILIVASGCKVRRDQIYFNNLPDSLKSLNVPAAAYAEPLIQPNDVLSIVIQTIDPSSSTLVNQVTPTISTTVSAGGAPSPAVTGFIVDKDGKIKLPWMGELKVGGLTIFKARELVDAEARKFFKEPNVQVSYAAYKVTVVGEVLHPATYNIPIEKVTIFDAISMAGDITIYGKKNNVLLVRDSLNEKHLVRLDLNSSSVFKSPYYYLKQNDLIYVEASKDKVATSDAYRTRTVTIAVTLISAFVVLLSRFIK